MIAPIQISAGLIFLIGLLGTTMSLFSDTLIAALPTLQAALATSDRDTQMLITLFFVTSGLISLFVGVLADAYGRRTMLIGALMLLTITSAGCALSVSIQQLWVLRVLQGMAGCVGLILSRTIIRDLVSGVQAKKAIGQISLIQTITPVLTSVMGAWVATHFGWPPVFACMGAAAALLLIVVARYLPESLPVERRTPVQPAAILQAYRLVFGSGVFWRMAVTQALNWTAVFLYMATAPKVITGHLGLASTEIYKIFAAIMLPMLTGFLLLPRLLERFGPRQVMVVAYGCYLVAVILNLAISALEFNTLVVLVPISICSLGVALALPLLLGEALEPFPDNSGMASSCQMFLQYAFMVLTAGVIAPMAWHSLLGLALAQAGMLVVGFILMLWQQQIVRAAHNPIS